MNVEYLLYRSRRWVVALVVAGCLAVPTVVGPLFSRSQSDTQSSTWIETPVLADGSEAGLGGGG